MLKKKCIVTGGTKKDVGNIATLIINIKKLNIKIDEVVVFHDGISLCDQKKINKIFPTKFFIFNFKDYNPANFSIEINEYFSPMVLCKYECFRLLSEYSCVIWTDYDVVLKTNFNDLLNEHTCNAQFLPDGKQTIEVQFHEGIKDVATQFDYSKIANCYSIFVLYDNFDYQSAYIYCVNIANKYGKYLHYGEQGALDFMLQNQKLLVNYLPKEYSIHPTSEFASKALILHAYGQPKYWNGLYNEEWKRNYEEWLKVYYGVFYKIIPLLKKIKNKLGQIYKKLK